MGPLDTKFCPPATLTIPNSPGWPPGTGVEFLLHGTDVAEEWASYGDWARVSDGAVSGDGLTSASDPDGGLPVLGLVGVRLKN